MSYEGGEGLSEVPEIPVIPEIPEIPEVPELAEVGEVREVREVISEENSPSARVRAVLENNLKAILADGRAPRNDHEYQWNQDGDKVVKITEVVEQPAALWVSGGYTQIREFNSGRQYVTDNKGNHFMKEAEPLDIQIAKQAAEVGAAPRLIEHKLRNRSFLGDTQISEGFFSAGGNIEFSRIESQVMEALVKRDPGNQGKSLVEIGQALNAKAASVK